MTKSLQQSTIPSSPPDVPTLVKLSTPGPTNGSDDDQESSWSFGEDDDEPTNQLPLRARFPHLDVSGDMLSPYSKAQGSSSVTATPQRNGDKDARSSIFDWSEHQSVPSAPEVDGKKNVVTNKFGTWGVGSKGVTEDWNEDFDFEEPQVPVPVMGPGGEKRLDSGVMFVPKSIQEQQTNVLANITLLRDWGLLIEELKELRTRAAALNLLDGPNEKTWDEVDAMIDLADQESDDITLDPRYTPPSSPTFDFDEFEEALSGISPRPRPKLPETVPEEAALPGPHPVYTHGETDLPRTVTTPTRPRKDSEAVAKLVIAALQQKRNVPESTNGSKADQPAKKVPFDTATLRRIVPYVQELRDKIKKTIREAEGLYSSPSYRNRSAEDPSFSKIFREPPESPSVRRASRRSTPAFDRTRSDESFTSTNDDLAGRMKLMTVS
ncbi:hypothetical protein H2203_002871 [Taxawa tesnikishii (nom. ined.)]|nr:hypothetical protein H2203_002871 [Dothideales sp. JES 119]